ncbi:MAG: hypothetical protein HY764_01075 [Candidatus Portnoybacteria bacterium]|nr:hypothetical protein [Candidatus Portnoybacteria bacterium]
MKKRYLLYLILPVMGLAIAGVASAQGWFHFGMFGMGTANNATPEQMAQQQQTMFQKEADLLGVGIDDVKNAWAQGKTLEELAKEHNITTEQLKQKMTDQRKQQMTDYLKTLVDQGVITQAQADQRMQFMEEHMGQMTKMMGKHGKGFGGFGCLSM